MPAEIIEDIHRQREAVELWWPLTGHVAPQPVWARRAYDHNGQEAWQHLCQKVLRQPTHRGLSIYVHVPFCERRCGFCDMYSHPRPRDWAEAEKRFASILCEEIACWSGQSKWKGRPVTTVHFGGGTPNLLRRPVFQKIVSALTKAFDITPTTEWALESTSRLLTEGHLEELKQMGFARLHVGVQSLCDSLRRRIGRKETAAQVAQKLINAMARGFIVSADLLFGLPGQNTSDWLETLRRLIELEIDGVSLYQLQRTTRNQLFWDRSDRVSAEPRTDYMLFQVGEHYLRLHGYQKTFFTHFSRSRDRNLYYSHVTRGEDLLALGPAADGVFSDYLYRHPELDGYTRGVCPALEGGLRESPWEQRIRPVVAAMMNAVVPAGMLKDIGAAHLRDLWLACDVLRRGQTADTYELTANGSWFMDRLIDQLHRLGEIS